MHDPRAAYAAADLVLGMGSSALRALSIGRPVVVQGEEGFSKLFEPETLPYFLRHGMWGRAETGLDGRAAGRASFEACSPTRRRRAELGAFGRRTVEERFSLSRAARPAARDLLRGAGPGRSRTSSADAATAARRAVRLELDNHDPRRKRARHRGEASLLAAAERAHA